MRVLIGWARGGVRKRAWLRAVRGSGRAGARRGAMRGGCRLTTLLFLALLRGLCHGRDPAPGAVTCGSVLKLLNTRHSVRLHSHEVKYGSGEQAGGRRAEGLRNDARGERGKWQELRSTEGTSGERGREMAGKEPAGAGMGQGGGCDRGR